jgi:hypothetical protein
LLRAQGLYVWDDGALRCIAAVMLQTRRS